MHQQFWFVVAHCSILQVFEKLLDVYCPVCWVHGVLSGKGGKWKVKWNEEDRRHPRFSKKVVFMHLELIKNLRKEFFTEDQDKVKELMLKYGAYGNIIKP